MRGQRTARICAGALYQHGLLSSSAETTTESAPRNHPFTVITRAAAHSGCATIAATGHAGITVDMRLFLFSLCFYMSHTVLAAPGDGAAGTIIWAKNHAPPFYIKEGKEAGEGFADVVQRMLEQALPQYEHQIAHMPLQRLSDFWGKQHNYCFASMIYEPIPTNHKYVLSQPNVYYLPHGVITRRPFAPVDDSGTVSLEALLKRQELVLGVINNRTFGTTVNDLLSQYKHVTPVYVRSDRDGLRSLLQMLLLERIDYLLDYPFVYQFYQREPEFRQQLQLMTIDETAGEGILGAIGCTNNKWGKATIVDIDHALEQLLMTPEYRNFVAGWQAIGMSQTQYWQKFDTERKRTPSAVRAQNSANKAAQ